ncbi:lytic transglycosylase domain-containing protein [Cronobacter sakazakii]|uniref:lytic transglycosylase domain-containing protein n=1 Tax=Cronobacter sakazakii TaxID=28141 RepID=UPI000DA1BD4A|nr:lytic transglycosylase domain-containing protein [Cronobacter sakazakii]ELY7546284.1 lytic transglycosylase domain-containing protein [Cronobacter turicensis]
MRKLLLLFLAATLSARAAPEMCFNQAGRDYGIDPLLLTAISIKESRLNPTAINGSNSNGTEDVCGMQINSSHYGKLKAFNISRADLLSDPCICVYTGAWVLAKNFKSYGKNWDSVGMYNTGASPNLIKRRRAYAKDIKNIYRVLLARKIIADKQVGAESQRTATTITPATLPVEK